MRYGEPMGYSKNRSTKDPIALCGGIWLIDELHSVSKRRRQNYLSTRPQRAERVWSINDDDSSPANGERSDEEAGEMCLDAKVAGTHHGRDPAGNV